MYKIKLHQNQYNGEQYYVLFQDNVVINSHISDKRMNKFLSRNIALDDSKGIEKYLHYNNL